MEGDAKTTRDVLHYTSACDVMISAPCDAWAWAYKLGLVGSSSYAISFVTMGIAEIYILALQGNYAFNSSQSDGTVWYVLFSIHRQNI
jgi:hypothetical protein